MKALILSVSAGGGHTHAAEAIKNHIKLNSSTSNIKIIDTLKYINPIINKIIIGGYLKTIKLNPYFFGKLYNYSENDYGLTAIANKINEAMTYKLLPLIEQFQPEILISTHPFPTRMLSTLKIKYKMNIPAITIITDYAPHNFWLHPYMDAYIISNSDMIEKMILKGIPQKNIYPLGIPIDPNFMVHYEKNNTLKSLNLHENKFTILLMGGSLGIGKITNMYDNLIKIKKDIQIIVITGNNKKLYSQLIKSTKKSNKKTVILGYTKNVNKYMQACDLLITKPGGLTITEALVSKIPIALFSPIPGQEEKNAEFLIKHNLAINLKDSKTPVNLIEDLISSPEKLNKIKNNYNNFSKPFSGHNIYNLINKFIKKYNTKNIKNNIQPNYSKNTEKKFLKTIEKIFFYS